jgi:SAM-dependent methyltransferase
VTSAAAIEPTEFGNLQANLQFLARTGRLDAPADVLEVGCGTGTLLHRLRADGHRMQGVDVNAGLLEQARGRFGALPVQRVSGTALPFPDAAFDVVMSFDVFEHIPDSDAHLAEVRRVLRPGGAYLLQTPNKWTNVVFETIRWRSFTRFREDHCSLHSLAELETRLRRHGFLVRAWDVPVVNAFFRGKVRRYLGWPGLALLRILNPDHLPLMLRTNLYVSAIKGPDAGPA